MVRHHSDRDEAEKNTFAVSAIGVYDLRAKEWYLLWTGTTGRLDTGGKKQRFIMLSEVPSPGLKSKRLNLTYLVISS